MHQARRMLLVGWTRSPVAGIAAFQPGAHSGGLAAGIGRCEVLDAAGVQGTNALKRKINPTRVPIEQKESLRWLLNLQHATALLGEPDRCVHVGDRESDISELFCAARDAGTHFLVRSCANRRAGNGSTRIEAEMAEVRVKGKHKIEVRDRHGNTVEATIELRFRRVTVLLPVAKQKDYPPVEMTVICAQERGNPKGRYRIDWRLLTDLPVRSGAEAIEKLR